CFFSSQPAKTGNTRQRIARRRMRKSRCFTMRHLVCNNVAKIYAGLARLMSTSRERAFKAHGESDLKRKSRHFNRSFQRSCAELDRGPITRPGQIDAVAFIEAPPRGLPPRLYQKVSTKGRISTSRDQ